MANKPAAGFRLSTEQERVWTQQRDKVFVSQCVVMLEGSLDPSTLKESLRKTIQQHEILRTVFRQQPGLKVPFQVILEESDPTWQFLDLSSLDGASQQTVIESFKSETHEFDLQQGPLFQAALLKLSATLHTLIVELPTLLTDSRSLDNVVDEIGRNYEAISSSVERISEVMQYVDIVQWQNDLFESDDAKPFRDFWRDYYRKVDISAISSIPIPFEVKRESYGAEVQVTTTGLDSESLQILEAFSSQHSISSSDLLLSIWAILLARISAKTEVGLNCIFAGRKYEDLEQVLGLFERCIPLGIQLNPATPAIDIIRQTAGTVSAANQWQDGFRLPESESSSSNSGSSLPIAFEYITMASPQTFGHLKLTITEKRICREPNKLKLIVFRDQSELRLEFSYDSTSLQIAEVERVAVYFKSLLADVLEHPNKQIEDLRILSEKERRQLLVEWNQTASPYPRDKCVQELFEEQALLTPERAAVRFNDTELTYRELNEQSNQLAHYFLSLGVAPDSLVGMCLDRSTSLIVVILGILKAGGAYVPLTADNPKPRLTQQLSAAKVLITEQKFLALMPTFAGPILCVDRDHRQWSNLSRNNPALQLSTESLVYVLYTSGSTGQPKGVAVRHRNLTNYTHFITQLLKLKAHPDGLQFATVSTIAADLGNTCIYPSLVSGGCLNLISYEAATDPQDLAYCIAQHPIDVLKIVPSHLNALLQSPEANQILPRQYLITGGEPLSPKLLEAVMALNPACSLINHYGPTETTVGSLTLSVGKYDWNNSDLSSIPIGRPIANTQIYLLDAKKQPVPIGVTGELYIAGDGVTAGYVGDAVLTGERFVDNPFSQDSASRMYRTGDLACYLQDGNIEFLGRADDQVKIRGFRIELGEIETVLNSHPSVKQAVVLARDNESGEKRILAYVVRKPEIVTSGEELREFLKPQLPDYMIPAAVMVLPRLPLTSNGKLDRRELPEPELQQSQVYIPPHTPTEEVVATIWEEVLRRDRISTLDNFFNLGGHSLLATQVISRIRRILNVDLPLRTLFESPTIAGISQRIENSLRDPLTLLIPPITPADREQALPLSFAQQRLWLLDQMEPNNPLYNIPRRVRIYGDLKIGALTQSLNEILRRHESQRTTFAVENEQPIQIISSNVVIGVAIRDLTEPSIEDRVAEARRLAAAEALIPFDLTVGPLIRATLLRLAPDDHVLLLTMHHIVSDAWSAGLFFQEFSSLYESFSTGRPSELPDLALQYADYAAWQRKWFTGEVVNHQLAYWREQLSGVPPVLQLPIDRPRTKQQSFLGAHETVSFSRETSHAIKKLCRQEGTTLFMTLLAGFQTLLSRYSGEEQIVVGTDVANRTTTDTEKIIGFFINLLAIRTDLSGDPTFRELLGRVREVALGAYAHQDMPFDKLVEELQPERSLSHNPLVQVLFVMQNIPRQRRELSGLRLEPFELPITRSKFDLAVFMVDGDDELSSYWLYSTDLFDKTTVLRIASQFETLLSSAANQPDTRLSALELFSQDEKREQDADKKEKKQSQLKKLMTSEPKAISIPKT